MLNLLLERVATDSILVRFLMDAPIAISAVCERPFLMSFIRNIILAVLILSPFVLLQFGIAFKKYGVILFAIFLFIGVYIWFRTKGQVT